MQLVVNGFRDSAAKGLFSPTEYDDVQRFFESRPEFRPTPLVHLPGLARTVGLGDIAVKDESQRFGMNAFKIAGVAYAVARLHGRTSTLLCATEGNHGRAVARVARERGLKAVVYMRRSASDVRVSAVRDEGAVVVLVDGTYDEAVRRMAADADRTPDATIVSDTAWPGYEAIPRAIMAGYTWIVTEASRQWTAPPDIVVVQAGVGGLAAAVVSWFLDRTGARPFLMSAEPTAAGCVAASVAAGSRSSLVPGDTFMAGLRCGEVSSLALPVLTSGLDACLLVDDEFVMATIARLRAPAGDTPIDAGPSGACGLSGLLWWMTDADCGGSRRAADVAPGSSALVFNTEGGTNPARYAR